MKIKEELEKIIVSPIENEGFDLIELKVSRYKNSSRVQIFVDSDNGVKLDDCARISKALGLVIDDAQLFRGKYILEVSSPGLDRPLQTFKDFHRRIGETVEIFFDDAAVAPVTGELVGAEGEQIELHMKDGNKKLNLAGIRMGKIII